MTRTSQPCSDEELGDSNADTRAAGSSTGRAKLIVAALRRHFGHRRSPIWLELFIIAWLCWLYDDINNLSPLRRALAYSNGRFFLNLERAIHLDPEASLDHWLAGHPAWGWLAGNYYDNVHFVTTLGLIGVVWWWFPDRYRSLRNGLVLTNLLAMVIFWAVPTAPPRLIDPATYVDIVGRSNSFGSWHTGTLATAANQLAAMPSMHIGWAAWSALAAWRILPRRWWSGLVWFYPVVTSVVVMATGNHYLVDVIAGAAVFGLSQLVADRWQVWLTAREARRALVETEPATPELMAEPGLVAEPRLVAEAGLMAGAGVVVEAALVGAGVPGPAVEGPAGGEPLVPTLRRPQTVKKNVTCDGKLAKYVIFSSQVVKSITSRWLK